ncbi:MAG: SpoIID/LytB domain-containing protein [Hungatella hathewayi]|nr:SpoIID/LytB domain-containing protein [Hungatella hathewayi]
MRRIWTGCLLALLIPYVVTLVWSGSIRGEQQKQMAVVSGKRIALDGERTGYVDAEEYLIGMVGRQMPPDYGAEALKAQAVVARTYIYKKMGDSDEIKESELGITYIEESGLEKLWGSEKFVEYYEAIGDAVKATAGVVMTYEDEEIDALYHRASAGMTRAGDEHHPYLEPVESRRDVEAENYLSVMNWPAETFVNKLKELGEDTELAVSQVPESIQMIEKDGAGYVRKIQIGNHIYTGEEVSKALDLASSCFTLEGYEGQIRAVCKGIGHGYGLSQYGAKMMGEEGYTWEDILNYYYKNIVLISS